MGSRSFVAFAALLRLDCLLFFFLEELPTSIHSSSSTSLGVVAQQHLDGQLLSLFGEDWELPIVGEATEQPNNRPRGSRRPLRRLGRVV